MEASICVAAQGSSGLLKIQISHRLLIQELHLMAYVISNYLSVTFYAQLF